MYRANRLRADGRRKLRGKVLGPDQVLVIE